MKHAFLGVLFLSEYGKICVVIKDIDTDLHTFPLFYGMI